MSELYQRRPYIVGRGRIGSGMVHYTEYVVRNNQSPSQRTVPSGGKADVVHADVGATAGGTCSDKGERRRDRVSARATDRLNRHKRNPHRLAVGYACHSKYGTQSIVSNGGSAVPRPNLARKSVWGSRSDNREANPRNRYA